MRKRRQAPRDTPRRRQRGCHGLVPRNWQCETHKTLFLPPSLPSFFWAQAPHHLLTWVRPTAPATPSPFPLLGDSCHHSSTFPPTPSSLRVGRSDLSGLSAERFIWPALDLETSGSKWMFSHLDSLCERGFLSLPLLGPFQTQASPLSAFQ